MNVQLCLILYACIQILTEVIPVSSTTHLYLSSLASGCYFIPEEWLYHLFHLPTLAVIIVSYKDVLLRRYYRFFSFLPWKILRASKRERKFISSFIKSHLYVGVAAFTTWGLKNFVFPLGRMGCPPVSCILTAAFLALSWTGRRVPLAPISLKVSLSVGFFQALCGVIGASRFASTFAAARCMGVYPAKALRFSFLSFIPLIMGACAKAIFFFPKNPQQVAFCFSLSGWLAVISATILSYKVFHFVRRKMEREEYSVFIFYLLGVGAALTAFKFLQNNA